MSPSANDLASFAMRTAVQSDIAAHSLIVAQAPAAAPNCAVILCGGSGTRLWPVSRDAEPKQFHRFGADHSLLTQTVLRANALRSVDEIVVVCSRQHEALAREHVEPHATKPVRFVFEPVARNTACAIALAAAVSAPGAVMVVLPSDHHLQETSALEEAVVTAVTAARRGMLVTFGVRAAAPDTGFGYIQAGETVDGLAFVHRVARFIEKPARETAERLLSEGGYSWNSGMFVMQAGAFLDELRVHAAQIHAAALSAIDDAQRVGNAIRPQAQALQACPSISVDHAVFERSERVATVTLDAVWNDLGSWKAMAELMPVSRGEPSGTLVEVDAARNYVDAARVVALVGVSDLVVVDTPDALLVSHRDQAQSVRHVVRQLTDAHPPVVQSHRRVRRPWGDYDSVDRGDRHQVKRIRVSPGGRLSLQSHEHRAEHWVVVHGTARITVGSTTADHVEGEHAFIPAGAVHRLENPGEVTLEIIEVQIGGYLGEDDIVRHEDIYGRV